MSSRKRLLIDILFDPSASESEVDDAAMYLSERFDEEDDDDDVIEALISASNKFADHEMIAASCGESLGEIFIRKENMDLNRFNAIKGIALAEALSLIKYHRPDLYEELKRINSDHS